jgi:acyl carrier protein
MSAVGLDDDLTEVVALDSLASLDVLAAVEDHFGVRLPDDRLDELLTLRAILAAIEEEEELCVSD